MYKEVNCVYLYFHLDQKSLKFIFIFNCGKEYNIKCINLVILSVRVNGIKYIHFVVQESSELFHLAKPIKQ